MFLSECHAGRLPLVKMANVENQKIDEICADLRSTKVCKLTCGRQRDAYRKEFIKVFSHFPCSKGR